MILKPENIPPLVLPKGLIAKPPNKVTSKNMGGSHEKAYTFSPSIHSVVKLLRALSSVGQSTPLITGWSSVQARESPPFSQEKPHGE